MSEEQTHRIVRLSVHAFQKITAEGVEIVPNGPLVTLGGSNGAGKSSVLNSMVTVLTGKDALPAAAIHQGERKADTYIDFGEFTAELKLAENAPPRLVVKSKSGIPIKGPQTFLKANSNEILLDLTGFIRKGETPDGRREQANLLRKLVGIDFTELDARKAAAYEERKEMNRQVTTLQGKLSNWPLDPAAPKQEVVIGELLSKLAQVRQESEAGIRVLRREAATRIDEATAKNKANEGVKAAWQEANTAVGKTENVIAEIDRDISELETLLADKKRMRAQCVTSLGKQRTHLTEMEHKVAALKYEDLAAIRRESEQAEQQAKQKLAEAEAPINQQIADADAANTKFRNNQRHQEIKAEINTAQEQSDALTAEIERIEKTKQDQLRAAKFPLPGLSFDQDGIIINGLPLSSASTAEQLKAALAIGFALRPAIRVAIIREASMFDAKSLADLQALMEQYQGQAWLEDNRTTAPDAIIIEEGRIAQ